ncbi:cell division protein ZapA [Alkalimarinus sediminis]|uniref:Cell division protein ZapA n=1 Tax=Alkalimarinus sediminis TaxID=1632866 RepID=A0A9E8HPV5_9ALTE|nr:cell division protein ZapA [Alkalimarinus sediminis]UZW74336.1 cell division protein ZapA [Alkalimarinus sediminis]
MPESNTVEVKILDKEYLIACPDEARPQLESAAKHLDSKMREIRNTGKVHGTERIAVMAALNITHDLQQGSQLSEDTHKVIQDLDQKLDAALAKA